MKESRSTTTLFWNGFWRVLTTQWLEKMRQSGKSVEFFFCFNVKMTWKIFEFWPIIQIDITDVDHKKASVSKIKSVFQTE